MKSKSVVPVVLLLVVLAVGAAMWMVLSGDEETTVVDADPDATQVDEPDEPETAAPKRERRKRNTYKRKGDGSVVGLVLEYGTDKPLGGMAVQLYAGADGPNETLEAETDENGAFHFDDVSNYAEWTLLGDAPEPLQDLSLPGVGVVEDQETDLGRIYVTPGFEVPGLVVDEYGEPIPGATVKAVRTPAESRGMDLLRLIREVPQEPVAVDKDKTDKDGKFNLKKVPPGTYEVIAFKPGYQMRIEREVVITPEVSDRPMRIVLAVGFQLEGRVVRKSEGAVEDLQVIAFPEPDGMDGFLTMDKRFARTDENGEFKLDGLSGGEYVLAVAPEGEPFALKTNFQVPDTTFLEVVLEGESWLEGYVTNLDKEPIENAQLYVLSDFNRDTPVVGTTQTDARGYYRLKGLKTGPLQAMIVQAEGYSPYPEDLIKMFGRGGGSEEVNVEEGGNRKDITMQKGASIKGVVLDQSSDEPIVGARVSLLSAFAFFGGGRGDTTDEKGEFELTSIPPGTAVLSVSKDGYYQPGMGPQALMMVFGSAMSGAGAKEDSGKGTTVVVSEPEQVIERELKLARGSTLKGIVLTPEGKPVAGARVSLQADTGRGMMGGIARLFGTSEPRITDAAGKFEIPGPAPGSPAKIVAKAPQFLDGESEQIKAKPGELIEGLEITMRVGAVLAGNVTGADGEPLAGALVRWIEKPDNEWSATWELRQASPHRTDENGSFRIANVETGNLIVQVKHADHMSASRNDVVSEEGVSQDLSFAMEQGLIIKGKVMGPDGRGRSGARVDVNRQGGKPASDPYYQDPRNVRTKDGGAFELTGLPSGDYQISARADDTAPSESLTVKSGGGTPVTLQLIQSFPISGVVRGEDGVGVQGVQISCVRVEDNGTEKHVDNETSDGDGNFEFENVPSGTYRLKTSQGWFGMGERPNVKNTQMDGVEAGRTDVVLTVQSGLTIQASVVFADGTKPNEGWVNAQLLDERGKPGGDWKYTQILAGEFELKGLDEGTYLVRINSGAQQTDLIAEAGSSGLVVDFAAGATIGGRVVFADGTAAKNITVFANLKDGHRSRSGQTDEDGRYELKAVPPGTWRVSANGNQPQESGGGMPAPKPVTQVGVVEDVQVGESGAVNGIDIQLQQAEAPPPK